MSVKFYQIKLVDWLKNKLQLKLYHFKCLSHFSLLFCNLNQIYKNAPESKMYRIPLQKSAAFKSKGVHLNIDAPFPHLSHVKCCTS